MTKRLFGSITLGECLIKLGFTLVKQSGTSHMKFNPPKNNLTPKGVPAYMVIQTNKKQYDPHSCSRYISELVRKGYDRKLILQYLEK